MKSHDIVELEANQNDDDCIAGDFHGNIGSFNQALAYVKSKPGARFFIAGDLLDRGPDSLGVLNAVYDNPGVVFAVRGNHEEMALDSIKSLEDVLLKMAADGVEIKDSEEIEKRRQTNRELSLHFNDNEGIWLFRLFLQELNNNQITVRDGVVEYTNDCEIKKLKDRLNALPYIICVRGGGATEKAKVGFHSSFNVVHADMPYDDIVLRERIKNGQGLTPQEKKYSIWARDHGSTLFRNNGRNKYSAITYCGHNIVLNAPTRCVRDEINTVCLDAGTYYSNIVLLMNHTQKTVTRMTLNDAPVVPQSRASRLSRVLREINDHLTSEQKRENLLLNLTVVCQNIKKVHRFLAKKNKNNDRYYDHIEYLLNNDGLKQFGVQSRKEFDEKLMEIILAEVKTMFSVAKVEAFLLAITDTWPEEMLNHGELLEYVLKNNGLLHLQVASIDDYFAKLGAQELNLHGLSFFSKWKTIEPEIAEANADLQQKHGS